MPKLSEIAKELRRVADALDKGSSEPNVQPYLTFYPDTKEQFLELARLLPRPMYKEFSAADYKLRNLPVIDGTRRWDACPVDVSVKIDRSKVCKLVKEAQPAVYECESLLSAEEEESLVAGSQAEEGR